MYRIVERQDLVPNTHLFKIAAPAVARKARPGQFIMLRVTDKGERIPLTIADWDEEGGTVTTVVQEVGKTTHDLAELHAGDSIQDFVGPLGLPTHIEKMGTVVMVAGGFAVAVVYPIARAMRQAGNKVISILGARNKDLLFWQDQLKSVSDQTIVMTDDGSVGRKGLVTEPLKELLTEGAVNHVIAIGPSIMMKFASLTSKPFGVKTIVSMNPIMVDGTGMCGCCRLSVNGQTKFACVDGPDFDGHQVDWDQLMARQKTYVAEEKVSYDQWLAAHASQLKAVK